ncbi:MAG: hypothetical protein RLZZ401_1191 [Pseudomonadota bacterium]
MKSPNFLPHIAGLALAGALGGAATAGVLSGRETASLTNLGLTTANVLTVNPDGVGHVLLVPYFSAQNDNATILSVTNSDYLNGKAVKIRFRGAANGDRLLDLTVFLSPNDVWNGVVTQNPATGIGQLSTGDSSCTLPAMGKGVNVNFSSSRLNPALSPADLAGNTREGYIEIITMADIPASLAQNSLSQSIQHVNGVPRNCGAAAVLATLTDASTESAAAGMGFATPTTGLHGTWTVLSVAKTLTFSGDAVALQALDNATGLPARANYVLFPQSEALASNGDVLTADPALRSNPAGSKTSSGQTTGYVPVTGGLPVVQAVWGDFPDLSTPYLAGMTIPNLQAAETSKVLAIKSLVNEYVTEAGIGAATDWLLSMPTKRYAVGIDYRQVTPVLIYSVMLGAASTEYFASDTVTLNQGKVCWQAASSQPTFYDRDEGLRAPGVGFTRARQLCGATSALMVGATPLSALGAAVATENTENMAFTNGWARLDTSNRGPGLPVLGAAFIKASNPNAAAGVSGNYGILSPHSVGR